MRESLISIILPAYNAQALIAAAIDSVLAQTYPAWELIVVDDGSTDQTRAIIEAYQLKDQRIRVFANARNSGVAHTRNTGLQHASGDYIAFIDSDDMWHKEKLAVQLDFMRSSSVALSYTAYERYRDDQYVNTVVPPAVADYAVLLNGNCIGLSTAMLCRDILGDTRFVKMGHEDYIFWLTLVQKNNMTARCVLPSSQPWVRYNVHEQSLSGNKFKALRWQWKIYREVLGLSLVKSGYHLYRYAVQAIRKRM